MTNATPTKVEKKIFMGIELDVLVGHPEHDLLFVATQVARAAGLKHPSMAIQGFHKSSAGAKIRISDLPNDALSFLLRVKALPAPTNTWLFDEPRVYAMLLAGHAPQSEPFRKWVTEEVLPTIRKTGSYNAADSANPIAQSVMDELKAVRGEVVELRAIIAKLVEAQEQKPSLSQAPAVVSPYEGDRKASSGTRARQGLQKPSLWTQGQPSVSSYQVPIRA